MHVWHDRCPGAIEKKKDKVFNHLYYNWALLSIVLEAIRRMCESVSDKKACSRHVIIFASSWLIITFWQNTKEETIPTRPGVSFTSFLFQGRKVKNHEIKSCTFWGSFLNVYFIGFFAMVESLQHSAHWKNKQISNTFFFDLGDHTFRPWYFGHFLQNEIPNERAKLQKTNFVFQILLHNKTF